MDIREISSGRTGAPSREVCDGGRESAQQAGGRLEVALLAAGLIVTSIAVFVTAGAKALARWSGAE